MSRLEVIEVTDDFDQDVMILHRIDIETIDIEVTLGTLLNVTQAYDKGVTQLHHKKVADNVH